VEQALHSSKAIQFGTFEVNARAGELRKSGVRIKLTGQPFQVLTILLEQPGVIVTREELQKRLWPDSFVDFDHNLNTAINKIREVLGDSAESPRFVETVPRRGYRFIAPTKERDELTGSRRAEESAEPQRAAAGKFRKFLVPGVVLVVALGGVFLLGLGLGWKSWKHKPASAVPLAQRQLTARSWDNPIFSASISRDGKYFAYQDKDGISIQDIENGDSHPLSGTIGLFVEDWYPDNLRLLASDGENLWLIFVASGEKRRLVAQASSAKISLDGSQILFNRATELWMMPAAGGESRLLFGPATKDEILKEYSWSPDGKSVAYIRTPRGPGPCTLETRTLSDANTRILLSDKDLEGLEGSVLKWLPDGRLLFVLFKQSANDLWTLSLDSSGAPTGAPVRLTNTTGVVPLSLSVSADGKHLAALYYRDTSAVFIANLANSSGKLEQSRRLTDDSWSNVPQAWTPDGQTLFYRSKRSNVNLFQHSLSSNSAKLFAGGGAVDYEAASVSPDGQWLLALVSQREGEKNQAVSGSKFLDLRIARNHELLRFPISGGNPEMILSTLHPAGIDCARSGFRICLLSEASGRQMTISTVDPIRGRLEEMAKVDTDESTWWAVSPDGSKVVLVEPDVSDSLRILDLQSKRIEVIRPRRITDLQGKLIEMTNLTPSQLGFEIPAWSADAGRVFISAFPNGKKGRLLEMDLTGNARILLESPFWIGFPVASPDGKRLAYSYDVEESNVTLLEHF